MDTMTKILDAKKRIIVCVFYVGLCGLLTREMHKNQVSSAYTIVSVEVIGHISPFKPF